MMNITRDLCIMRKKRLQNWSDEETLTLLEGVALEYKNIMCKQQTLEALTAKRMLWSSISEKVSTVLGRERDSASCKKRWRDLRSTFLHKKNKNNTALTEGVKQEPIPFDDLIDNILKTDLNPSGIVDVECLDGVDTFGPGHMECANRDGIDTFGPGHMECANRDGIKTEFNQDDEIHSIETSSAQSSVAMVKISREFVLPRPASDSSRESESALSMPIPNITYCRADSPVAAASSPPPVKKSKTSFHYLNGLETRQKCDEEEDLLRTKWLKSEIEKNQSIIETNRLKQEKFKLEIEEIKARMTKGKK